MHPIALILIALAFAAALFALAATVERRPEHFAGYRLRRHVYGLSLAVYCTSWTFYGAVGTAAVEGWNYLAIYVGPILVFALGARFIERIISEVQAEGATTISDFIGARFSKSRGLAALVTLTAVLGILPYIALQLRSIGASFALVAGRGDVIAAMVVAAIGLGGFALLFGTRRYDAAGRNEGIVYATAFESLVKLGALLFVGLLATILFVQAGAPVRAQGLAQLQASFAPSHIGFDLFVIAFISMAAILCLPRQFYTMVIEARSPSDLRGARWMFVFYLLLMTVVVVPIALAGLALLPPGVPADQFVLRLPMQGAGPVATAIAFLGGFSAATAMVVVESVALATMVSNDLIAPALLRGGWASGTAHMGRRVLWMRRLSIVLVIAAALFWGVSVRADERLAQIGHIAFAAMAQIAPLLILAVGGKDRDATAAKAGLSAGLVLWLFTLALPPVLPPEWLMALHGTAFDPHRLFGIGQASPIVHGVLWSLGINLAVFALVAARRVRPAAAPIRLVRPPAGAVTDVSELADFVARFVGEARTVEIFPDRYAARRVERADARRAERAIASVVGAPSAHALMASALGGARLDHRDVARMLDKGGQSLEFSKGLLAATLENIDPGVSVIDGNQRLIAWNSRYQELFDYPEGMVHVGRPVADLIRFNAERGECGPGEVEAHVERRLYHLRRGVPHSFERTRPDGRVIKTVGGPMPGGGYVMCFTDTTAEAVARRDLERARAELEERVARRTMELTRANTELAAATREKTRFLATASHDLLQPLHAARLFCAALDRDLDQRGKPLLARIERSIGAADQLLRALLDISKLDAGGIEPSPERFRLRPLLTEVVEGFRPLADEKGLQLRLSGIDGTVETDPALLRSILQNFVSNALRYTENGGVLVGARRRGDMFAVEVWDTGPGIPEDKQGIIFREFERLGAGGEAGVGLGLAIVDRTARLIGAQVTLRSVEGRGSVFGIRLPASTPAPRIRPKRDSRPGGARRHRILVVDDDPVILEASRAAATSAGHDVRSAESPEEALALAAWPEAALVDYQLGTAMDGIALIAELRARNPGIKVALVTADTSPAMHRRAADATIPVLAKPLSFDRIAEFLAAPFPAPFPAPAV